MSQEFPPPIKSQHEKEIIERLIWKLTRRGVIGHRQEEVGRVISWLVADEQSHANDLISRIIRHPRCPLEYSESEDVIQLRSYQAAIQYVEELGGQTEWL